MSTKAIIEARMTSSRLPGKVMIPILGKPVLQHLVERLRRSALLDGIVIATTIKETDDVLESLARQLGIECFRGSEEDVLDRVLRAAKATGTRAIVEITGDCPLVDPAIVDRAIALHRDSGCDYVSNTLVRTFPRGLDVQVFSTDVLARVSDLTDDPVDHEHVSLHIYEHPEIFSLLNFESGWPATCADWRITLDTADDLRLIRNIFEMLSPENPAFDAEAIRHLLDERPDLADINRHIVQKQVR